MKVVLEFDLIDKTYCEGCPMMLHMKHGYGNQCRVNLDVLECNSDNRCSPRTVRPDWCKEKHGD